MLDTPKPWYRSKGVWGSLVVVLAGMANMFFGIQIDEAGQVEINDFLDRAVTIIDDILILGGGVIALYGRIMAVRPIGAS